MASGAAPKKMESDVSIMLKLDTCSSMHHNNWRTSVPPVIGLATSFFLGQNRSVCERLTSALMTAWCV